MSAVPNLPEEILHQRTSNAAAAQKHLAQAKERQVEHIEDVVSNEKKSVNGTTTRHIDDDAKTAEVPFLLHDTPIENQRPIKVIVIGAGYSGVYCGIRIPERLRNCELVIYEKNAGIGGTWYENRYPGAACDIPSHSYQFSFNPRHDWSSLYAPSWEIRDYIESTAKKFGADRFIKLQHEITDCRWSQDRGKWFVQVKKPDGTTSEDSCDVLISARGLLNTKQWPDIKSFNTFRGEVMHSAAWNTNYDFRNKRIGVIGSGSSAIQIIPKLQKLSGAQLNCFMRSRTWISPPFGQRVADEYKLDDSMLISQEQIAQFEADPEAWFEFRTKIEADANNIHALTLKGSEMQVAAQKMFEETMRSRLAKEPEYYDRIKPEFSPGCRRLTPGPGFLEALVEDNVAFISDKISHMEQNGVVTEDGKLHEIDVLVCATGFYASAAPPFPVVGLNGRTLQEHWHDRATNYLSLATDALPNHFFMLGPNGAIAEGSLTMMIESTGDYIVKALRKLQKDNLKSLVIKPRLVRDFTRYCDAYFSGTVFKDSCNSWYRKNGQGLPSPHVTGLWPGSTLHCIEALRSPRWEDYEYEYWEEENGAEVNLMGWLGNGWAVNQLREEVRDVDLAFYLYPEFQERDLGVPEAPRPEENEHYRIRPWSY
ncbi:Putative flavin monooxygenase, FAD/NAD(P)-binding domain superfamily [Septoria linicola]|uniref:Flavin monooxygenase, FAD/NAD(P)-binding domain superfamily n=1 Tax=Septoria linicola TaxID=215465 RepID=A0A9Q9AGE2_9PEZI|nr:putative flavin monooxygenase, FAD/NAD(P)-binding domain superfamily [Septoria linicola]USW48637.1 Putative flavin monooxygenase, FAD/NAD(P)-binding domain superfamily [Septoria linicola]